MKTAGLKKLRKKLKKHLTKRERCGKIATVPPPRAVAANESAEKTSEKEEKVLDKAKSLW